MPASRFTAACVLGRVGPHVTPVAAIEAEGRWWFVTSRSAAKVRLLRNDPRIALTRIDGDRTLVVSGRAVIVEHPLDLLSRPDLAVRVGPAAFRLAVDHGRDLVGYVAAAIDGEPVPVEWSPTGRVLVAVVPDRVSILPRPARSAPSATDTIGLADPDGPFAVPGQFDGERITILPSILARRPDWSLGVAAMVEGPAADRPTRQSGLLVRGAATAVAETADVTTIEVAARSLVRWDGFAASSTRFEPATA